MNLSFGVCNLSLVPLRTEASDKSEMCSQLLFGDHFTLLEVGEKWSRILTEYDEYEGWIDNKQYVKINQTAFDGLSNAKSILGLEVFCKAYKTDNQLVLKLLAGSTIPHHVDDLFYLGDTRYKIEGKTVNPKYSEFRSGVKDAAQFYLGSPYLWGGRSIFGIDCSGFSQMVFKQFGIKLKRDAWQQAEQGELVAFLQEARTGDLAFFDNDEGRITHVGIMLNNQTIIHASGTVRIDPIDNQGIFNAELNRYTHKLRIVKRFS
jgi:gamma-D-glutamyl-L-lysine dipeptidyl-peptidase